MRAVAFNRGRALVVALLIASVVVGVLVMTSSDKKEPADNAYVVEYGVTGDTGGATEAVATTGLKTAHKRHKIRSSDLGQLLITGMSGTVPSADLLERVRRGEVAGVIIMGENVDTVEQLAAIKRKLLGAASAGHRLSPLVMVDQEGGDVKRFRTAEPTRSARSMASLPTPDLESIGSRTGEDLLARGVNIDLAPVVDVAHERDNFLGSRTFGTDAADVARAGCAFVHGLNQSGVFATLKHFPGLGRAGKVNTDVAPVAIAGSLSDLSADWLPYKRCAMEPNNLIMVANASYPDAFGRLPASVNPKVYAAIRKTLDFDGVVITDSLSAGGLRGTGRPAVEAIDAGADLALFVSETASAAAYEQLRREFARGGFDSKRLAKSVQRVEALRRRIGATQ